MNKNKYEVIDTIYMLNNKNQDFHNARKLALTKAFPVMLGIAFLGVGYGVYMRSCGFDMIWPICMAATIFAGSMEFVTVSLLLSTFNPGYALLLTLIVNGRHLFYGISMLEKYGEWKKETMGCFRIDRRSVFVKLYDRCASGNRPELVHVICFCCIFYISWIGGTVVGAVSACKAVVDIKGVGFVMTALFIVIFISQWQKRTHTRQFHIRISGCGGMSSTFGKTYFMLPTILIITTIFTVRLVDYKG